MTEAEVGCESGESVEPVVVPEGVKAFVEAHPSECEITSSGKVRFLLTGMDFPSSSAPEVLERYLGGKAMRRALVDKRNKEFDFGAHAKWIAPHKVKSENNFLWCRLTHRTLPRDAAIVSAHVGGRRFKAALKKAEAAEAEAERIRQKRLEKAAKRKASEREARKSADDDGDSADPNPSESNGIDSDEPMGAGAVNVERNSAADIAMADESESSDGEGAGSEMNTAGPISDEDGDGPGHNDEAEEEGEEVDVFWTRGRAPAQASKHRPGKAVTPVDDPPHTAKQNTGDDGDEDDEWVALSTSLALKANKSGEGKVSANRQKASKASKKKRSVKHSLEKGSDASNDVGESPRAGKRKRDKGSVPKKVRQPSTRTRYSVVESTS